MSKNRLILETVSLGLGDLTDQFVFVGGTVVELYVSSQTYSEVRETDDVDCVVEVSSLASYYALEQKLRDLGFHNDM
jgi:hypothetical protein